MESGAVRFRPIFLTAGTTTLGAWPITLDPIFSGLAWSIIFGMIVSTAFTLVVIPVVYYLLYGRKQIRQLPALYCKAWGLSILHKPRGNVMKMVMVICPESRRRKPYGDLIAQHEVHAYSELHDITGAGEKGIKYGDRIWPGKSVIVFTVVSEGKKAELLAALKGCRDSLQSEESLRALCGSGGRGAIANKEFCLRPRSHPST